MYALLRLRSVLSLLFVPAVLCVFVSTAPTQQWAYRLHPERIQDLAIQPMRGPHALSLGGEPRFVGYDDAASWFHDVGEGVARSAPLAPESIPFEQRFTIELWTSLDYLEQQAGLVALQGGTVEARRGVFVGESRGCWLCGVTTTKSGLVTATASSAAVAREWTHLAVTFDGRRLTLFANGEEVAQADVKGNVEFGAEPELRLGGAVIGGKSTSVAAALHSVALHDRCLNKPSISKLAKRRPDRLAAAGRVSLSRHAHAPYDLDQANGRIDRAIDRGALWLLEQQNDKGAFCDRYSGERLGLTALAALALVESGEDPASDAIRQARNLLRKNPPEHTYDLGTYLLLLGAIRDADDRDVAAKMTVRLLSFESKLMPGAWAYPEALPDLSNTQFAALGLLGASQFGIEIPREVFERMVAVMVGQFRGKTQRSQRGGIRGLVTAYSYRPEDGFGTATMTTAATSIFAIADRVAGLRWEANAKLGKARQQSLDWVAANYEDCLGPYAIYGVERTAALLGMDRFGKHDWYARASENIVGNQDRDGSWSNGSISDSSFNLLVLRRATRRMTQQVPLTGAGTVVQQRGDLRFCYRPGPEPRVWFAGFVAEWEARGPRVVEVRWLIDGRVVKTLAGDSAAPWAGEAFEIEPQELATGRHELRLEVDVTDAEGQAVTLEGRPMLVGR